MDDYNSTSNNIYGKQDDYQCSSCEGKGKIKYIYTSQALRSYSDLHEYGRLKVAYRICPDCNGTGSIIPFWRRFN